MNLHLYKIIKDHSNPKFQFNENIKILNQKNFDHEILKNYIFE